MQSPASSRIKCNDLDGWLHGLPLQERHTQMTRSKVAVPASRAASLAVLLLVPLVAGCAGPAEPGTLRLGFFANITHAQPLYGIESGLYARHLEGIEFSSMAFHAGPAALEALVSGGVDVVYVGPMPTIHAVTHYGDVVRVIAGSALGGASFIVQPGTDMTQLAGKRFASPQVGNTQDIILKHWLAQQGHATRDQGGDIDIINAPNPDILSLFQRKGIDGAWVPEPWATRLQKEAGGIVHVDEATLWPDGKYITTQLVTTKAYLASHPEEVRRLLEAHVEATERLHRRDAELNATINAAIERVTGKRLPPDVLSAALARVNFTSQPHPAVMQTLADRFRALGFAAPTPEAIANAYDPAPMQSIVARREATA